MYNYKVKLKLNTDIVETSQDDYKLLERYKGLEIIKNSEYYEKKYPHLRYVCFNYALNDHEIEECDEAYDILYNNYTPIQREDAGIGDLISFHRVKRNNIPDRDNCKHFAVISNFKINLNNGKEEIFIRSKFGAMSVFEGSIELLPDIYGNYYQIWRLGKTPFYMK